MRSRRKPLRRSSGPTCTEATRQLPLPIGPPASPRSTPPPPSRQLRATDTALATDQVLKTRQVVQIAGCQRRRGLSPYRLETILDSTRLRLEAAIFSALCKSLDVLPKETLRHPERSLPSLERGELLCEAYAWFRIEVPTAKLSLEQGLLVLNELARGEQIELAGCRSCSGVILSDRVSHGRLECVFCARAGRNQEDTREEPENEA